MTLTIDEKSPFYEHDLKLMRQADATFEKMLRELALLCEYAEQDKLHLLEYKLSKNTRKIYNEIKHQNNTAFKKLLEEAAEADAATSATNSVADSGKNILGLINKFHQDNKDDIGMLSSDDTFKASVPKNIGAEPGVLQKIASKVKSSYGASGSKVVINFLLSILTGAFQKMEKTYSQFNSDFLDAKKQGNAWKFIYSKIGPSMTVAKRKEDGTIEYVKDSSGPGFLNWVKDFVNKNPKWANVAVGLLINGAKLASVGLAGATGGASLAVGVIVGLILRTLVGRLKGETWGVALKKAVIVTGLSLIGGAITKGLFSYFKGGGFLDGAKSYFTGVPGADQAAKAVTDAATEIDMDTLKMANVSGLASQLHKAFPADQPPTADSLLKFFSSKGLDPKIAKDLAKSITGGDSASAAERFRDLWRMGGTSGDTVLFNKIKALATLPKDQYDKLLGSGGVSTAADTATDVAASQGAKVIKSSIFGNMYMDPNGRNFDPESANKLFRYATDFVKQQVADKKMMNLGSEDFLEYLSQKTNISEDNLNDLFDDDDNTLSFLGPILSNLARGGDSEETRQVLYNRIAGMMTTAGKNMSEYPGLVQAVGGQVAQAVKESVYKKVIKNLYL